MNIEKLKLLDDLKKELSDVKAKEMELRKEIMFEISNGYEGEKKTFDWINSEGEARVTCNLNLNLDVDMFKQYLHDEKLATLSPEEMGCIETTHKLKKSALKEIPDDSIIYELIDSKPALSTIKYEIK